MRIVFDSFLRILGISFIRNGGAWNEELADLLSHLIKFDLNRFQFELTFRTWSSLISTEGLDLTRGFHVCMIKFLASWAIVRKHPQLLVMLDYKLNLILIWYWFSFSETSWGCLKDCFRARVFDHYSEVCSHCFTSHCCCETLAYVLRFVWVAPFILTLLPVDDILVDKLKKVCQGLRLKVTARLEDGFLLIA